jgi:GH25 family lysozyme M1 (1,4-beta-N-acetylmuramidase)
MSIAEPIFGVDVHPAYQEGFNFDAALARGYKFAFLKTSEGPYRDGTVLSLPTFQQLANQAKASGILTGYYHYLVQGHATDSVSSGRMQADHFLRRVSNAGGIDGRLLAVDFEPYGEPGGQYYYLTPTNAVLESFLESLRKRVGEHPIVLYAGPGFWNGGTEPSGSFDRYGADVAWTAQYLDTDIHVHPQVYYQNNKDWDGGPNFDPPWDKPWGDVQPWFWQFTCAGRVAGMNIDVNAYRGTEEQLRALVAGRMLPPPEDSLVAGDLPAGTPHEITPAMGDREGWAERTWRVVREIEHRFGVVCSTYNNHGTTGRSMGIDIWVAPFQHKANAAQEALGDKIQEWVEANMGRLGIYYIIWWNWMRYHNGNWFDYTPYSKPASQGGWPYGSKDQQTRRHEDHVHLQIL